MLTYRRIGVVGSRIFKNYAQLSRVLMGYVNPEDEIVSGGAEGADSMAQRYAKEHGHAIYIIYPHWEHGISAGFARNKKIVEVSDLIIAFYAKGKFQKGGTSNTIMWAQKLEKPYLEIEEL